ncbi:hypothetical protein [Streptomyces tsukubensis]|uniref:hypothetical protein n=1 Tax=Streptomyces tsukubensis TaxID=83656 RepID=UPI003450CC03
MAERDVRWTMHDGERVEVPATIGGIRAALSKERRAQFDAESDAANVDDLYNVVRRWIVDMASFPSDEEILAQLREQGAARTAGIRSRTRRSPRRR